MSRLVRFCRIVTKSGYTYKFFGVSSVIYADTGRVIITYHDRGMKLTFCTDLNLIKLFSMECFYE